MNPRLMVHVRGLLMIPGKAKPRVTGTHVTSRSPELYPLTMFKNRVLPGGLVFFNAQAIWRGVVHMRVHACV